MYIVIYKIYLFFYVILQYIGIYSFNFVQFPLDTVLYVYIVYKNRYFI